jgi:signal transduction histidine kinase
VCAPPHARRRRHHRHHHRADELSELTRAWNEMAERVEQLVRGQKELLANVSHELRSPLARIRVALALLPEHAESAARLRDVEGDLGELDALIDAVLTTARLEGARLPLAPARVDVRALLTAIAERAAADPATAGCEVRVEPGPAFELEADGALLKRALWNLVENAAKYGAPPITLRAEAGEVNARIVVTDEGSGIPPGERSRVFEPFYRAGDKAHTPGGAARGFGLGLTLVRRVAEVHGGTIAAAPARVADGREIGCSMTIELPLRRAPNT